MLNELIAIIGGRAENAGFSQAAARKLLLENDKNWPEGVLEKQLCYWQSSFASILLVDITSESRSEAKQMAKRAETYLDAAIVQREKSGHVIDGYLVLATTQLNDELKDFIVEIEKDTRFVRKHVVFYGKKGWERYQRISPLGLATSFDQFAPTPFIPDGAASLQLLESLAKMGSEELAKLHGKEWNLNE